MKDLKTKNITNSMINKISRHLKDKYYDVFLSKFEISGIDDYYTEEFILKELFYKGKICVFDLHGVPTATDYTINSWGINHRPISITPISPEAQNLMPKKLINEKDCVLGYLKSSKTGLVDCINLHISRMADLYAAMFVNLQVNKIPFLITGDNVDAFNVIIDRIYQNELAVFCPKEIAEMLQVYNTGATYLLDKYWTQILNEECQLLTELGIDNNTLNMERITADQSNANNVLINTTNDGFNRHLGHLCDKANELFGWSWSIKVKEQEVESIHEDGESEELENENN